MDRLINYPYHPVFLALLFWLSHYEQNWNELTFAYTWRSGLFLISASILLVVGLRLLTRSWGRAGIAASLVIFGFLFYGDLHDKLYFATYGYMSSFWFMSGWVVILALLVVGTVRVHSDLKAFNLVLNAVTLFVIIPPIYSIVSNLGYPEEVGADVSYLSKVEMQSLQAVGHEIADKPDIFFLIFDRFASDETLRDHYKYDNSDFSNALRHKGLYVADQAHANYTKTALSLASSLNLTHLEALAERMGPASRDWRPTYEMLQDHLVGKFLVAQDYQYIHLGSIWQPTRRNDMAHINFTGDSTIGTANTVLNEFENYLLSHTLVDRLVDNRLSGRLANVFKRHYQRVKAKFEYLKSIPQDTRPRFIFAHILAPHPPFAFQADGSFLPLEQQLELTIETNYINQLRYTADEILRTVDVLLKRTPQPIIIIQADEGPFPDRYRFNEETFDWRDATVAEFKQKFGIPTAYYFPDRDYAALHPGITPVNTFRLVFSKYFGADLPLLPDKSYSITSTNDLYSLFEITDKFRTHDGDKPNP